MNARRFLIFLTVFAVLLSACAQATPAPIAQAPHSPQVIVQTQVVEKTVVVNAQGEAKVATARPAPTLAPVSGAYNPPPNLLPPTPAPTDNIFQNYGVNPYVDASEDHLSTFSLDVDTAAYTVARRYVMEGNLPPADSVRVEEFVNYFNAGYANPSGVAFGIYADGAPSPFEPGTLILRFGVQGYQVPEEQRLPASLTLVIDMSGSMGQQNRLELVKQSLQVLVERLRADDIVAIVAYDTDAWVVLNGTNGSNRQAILNAIYSLHPRGSTNAEAGLTLGYQMAQTIYRQNATNRVILCSDGVANVGNTTSDQILASASEYALKGITLTTVGVGMGNYNDVLLEQLADKGDGNYAYVDTLDEARRIFAEQLTSTLQVIAMDAKVQVDFNDEVVGRYRLLGYENRAVADQDFRNDAVDAGEIGAGHHVTALYAVQLRPGASGRISTVQLRWQDPQTHSVQEINGNFNTWDLAPRFEEADPRFQLAVTVAQFAELLRLSPWTADSNIFQVLNHAVRLAGLLPEDKDVADFAALVSRASQIQALTRQ